MNVESKIVSTANLKTEIVAGRPYRLVSSDKELVVLATCAPDPDCSYFSGVAIHARHPGWKFGETYDLCDSTKFAPFTGELSLKFS